MLLGALVPLPEPNGHVRQEPPYDTVCQRCPYDLMDRAQEHSRPTALLQNFYNVSGTFVITERPTNNLKCRWNAGREGI